MNVTVMDRLADTSALATCFALNGLSFIVVIVALTSLRVGQIGRE